MTDSTTTDNRSQHWQQHMDSWSSSGLSRAQYCREQDLSYYVFNYWYSKLNKPSQPKKLVPVVVSNKSDFQPSHGLQVRLPNGVQISGVDQTSVGLVGQLIAQL